MFEHINEFYLKSKSNFLILWIVFVEQYFTQQQNIKFYGWVQEIGLENNVYSITTQENKIDFFKTQKIPLKYYQIPQRSFIAIEEEIGT